MKCLLVGIILGVGVLASSQAAIDTHEFTDDSQRQRYHDLTLVLRCPKCQNQNISESNSPIANDLRNEIHRMLSTGQSNEKIIDFMVSRYGEFVLYDPPLSSRTVLLWLGPIALLLIGGVAVVAIVTSRRHPRPAAGSALSDAERHRLVRMLQETTSTTEQNL